MKKIILTTLILVILVCMASCSSVRVTVAETTNPVTEITTASEVVSSSQNDGVSSGPNDEEWADENLPEASLIYYPFEKFASMSTDVVIAEFLGKQRLDKQFVEFKFTVCERLRGTAEGTISAYERPMIISMSGEHSSDGKDYRFRTDDYPFVVGNRYMLFIDGFDYAYLESPEYFLQWCVIDMADLSKSYMYGRHDMALHVKGIDFNTATLESMLEYVKSLLSNGKPVVEPVVKPVVEPAKNIEELVAMTPDIFVVTVGRKTDVIHRPMVDVDLHKCTIKEILKTDDATRPKDPLKIQFFQNTVKEGDEIIVFVDGDGHLYCFASKPTYIDCIQPLDKKQEIISLLENQK